MRFIATIVVPPLFLLIMQGCSGIYFIVGSTAQKFNDLAEYGFSKPTEKEIMAECENDILRKVRFDLVESSELITVNEMNGSTTIKTFEIHKNSVQDFVLDKLDGKSLYVITTDQNNTYTLSDVRGKYNPRCHMFGCEPICYIESYKINNEKKYGGAIDLE